MLIFYKGTAVLQKHYLIVFAFVLANIILGCSSSASKQVYNDTDLGISLEFPGTWKLERDERVLLLNLTPTETSLGEDPVSITILSVYDEGQELLAEFEDEVERVRRTNALGEVQFINLPNKFSINDSEAISATITILTQLDSETNLEPSTSLQPMDLIVIRDKDQLIVVHVQKSDINEFLNMQANDIVKSVQLISEN